MREHDFFKSRDQNGSPFWKSLHNIKHLFKWGFARKIGNGELTQFWNDVWITSSPLGVCFHRLYERCMDKDISIARCGGQNWEITPRRMLGPAEVVTAE
jgi:hypothetical protein